MNPIEMLKGIINPKEFVMNNLGMNSNPMIGNLIQMAKTGNNKGIEDFARNLFKEQGKNFDEEFAEFMKQING